MLKPAKGYQLGELLDDPRLNGDQPLGEPVLKQNMNEPMVQKDVLRVGVDNGVVLLRKWGSYYRTKDNSSEILFSTDDIVATEIEG